MTTKPASAGARDLAEAAHVDLSLVETDGDEITREDVWCYIDQRILREISTFEACVQPIVRDRRRPRRSVEEQW